MPQIWAKCRSGELSGIGQTRKSSWWRTTKSINLSWFASCRSSQNRRGVEVVVFLLPINQAYEVCFCFSLTCLQTLLPLRKNKKPGEGVKVGDPIRTGAQRLRHQQRMSFSQPERGLNDQRIARSGQ